MIRELLRHAGEQLLVAGGAVPAAADRPEPPRQVVDVDQVDDLLESPAYDLRLQSLDDDTAGRRRCVDPAGRCEYEARWSVRLETPAGSATYVRCDIHAILLVQDEMARHG